MSIDLSLYGSASQDKVQAQFEVHFRKVTGLDQSVRALEPLFSKSEWDKEQVILKENEAYLQDDYEELRDYCLSKSPNYQRE